MTRTCKTPLFVMALAVGFAAFLASAAQAQMNCGLRDSVVEKLDKEYGEVRRGFGLAGSTAIFEIWASEETSTWTILKTYPSGLTCVIAVGDDWQEDAGEPTPAGSPV